MKSNVTKAIARSLAQTAATRSRILIAAQAEFKAQGFTKSRLARIAREANSSTQRIYEIVGNKLDLYNTAMEANRAP